MKKLNSVIIACLILCGFCSTPAQQETPIEISPYIGDKLDRIERDYFKLFPKIEGFKEAEFYLNPDSTLRVNIKYMEDTKLRDTILNNYKSLSRIQNHILQTLTYYINDVKPNERGKYCSVFLVDSSEFSGELLSVGQQSIFIYPFNQKSYEEEADPFQIRNPANEQNPFNINHLYDSEIENVYFIEKSKIWSIIYPIIGSIAGAIIGYNLASGDSEDHHVSSGGSTQINFNFGLSEEDKKKFWGILGGSLVGMVATIPLVIFLPIETTSETIIETPFNEDDLEGLRDRSRYEDEEPYFLTKIR